MPANFFWNGKHLLFYNQICVPSCLCRDVVEVFHQRAHFGVDKLVAGVSRRYDVSALNTIAKDVVSRCPNCQSYQSYLQSLPIPNSIFQSISVDFLELPKVSRGTTSYGFVLVVLCRLSSFCVLIPTSKVSYFVRRR